MTHTQAQMISDLRKVAQQVAVPTGDFRDGGLCRAAPMTGLDDRSQPQRHPLRRIRAQWLPHAPARFLPDSARKKHLARHEVGLSA